MLYKSAAINTVSGVNMTTRRQLLKIKVVPLLSVRVMIVLLTKYYLLP